MVHGGRRSTSGKQPIFAVSAPLTSLPFLPWAEPGPGRPAASSPPPCSKKQDDYATLSRFAGKPFEGLLLNASASAKRHELSSVNQSNTPICVKKWEGAALRLQRAGSRIRRQARLHDGKGKSLFDGGSAIETRDLKPKETIEQSIPVAELFDTKAPGEYAVLACPVVGTSTPSQPARRRRFGLIGNPWHRAGDRQLFHVGRRNFRRCCCRLPK